MSIELSEDQSKALDTVLSSISPGSETTLVGPAGSGKTTLTKTIIEKSPRRVVLGAPTGKAALRLSEVTGQSAWTIHKLLYGDVYQEEDGELVFGNPGPPCAPGDLLIIDESSMINEYLYEELMGWVPKEASVLFVGDREQLPPVKGTWGPDLLYPSAALTEVHRQARGSIIIEFATAVRLGNGDEWSEKYDYSDDALQAYEDLDSAVEWLVYQREQDNDATLITYTHKIRRQLNAKVRRRLGVNEPLPVNGDKLVIKANNYEIGLMNGEVVTVEEIIKDSEKAMEIKFRESPIPALIYKDLIEGTGGEFWKFKKYNRNRRWAHVHFGQCLTVHSSQGSQWDNVGFVWGDAYNGLRGRDPEESRRFLYTAVTRAAKNLAIVFA